MLENTRFTKIESFYGLSFLINSRSSNGDSKGSSSISGCVFVDLEVVIVVIVTVAEFRALVVFVLVSEDSCRVKLKRVFGSELYQSLRILNTSLKISAVFRVAYSCQPIYSMIFRKLSEQPWMWSLYCTNALTTIGITVSSTLQSFSKPFINGGC